MAVKLYNFQTQDFDELSEEQAQAALLNRTHSTVEGQLVNFRDPDSGKTKAATGEDLLRLLQKGARLETEIERTARKEAEEYGSGAAAVKAAALGGASGLTFGLSNQALTKTGLVAPDTIRKLRDYNPGEYYGAEIGAAIGSMFIPGGQIAALAKGGKIAKTAASTMRGVQVATGAPRLVANLGARAAGIAGKNAIARAATASAVEGAFYATGQLISEEALGNAELTAQQVASQIGIGALLGGAFGGAISAGGIIARRAAGKLSRNVANRFGGVADDVAAGSLDDLAEAATGTPKPASVVDEIKEALGQGEKFDERGLFEQLKDAAGEDGVNLWKTFKQGIADDLDDILDPDRLRVRALGGKQRAVKEISKGLRGKQRNEALKQFGKDLDSMGIVRADDSIETMAEKASIQRKKLGSYIGEKLKQMDYIADTTPPKGADLFVSGERRTWLTADVIADDVVKNVLPRLDDGTLAGKRALNKIKEELELFRKTHGGKGLTLSDAWDYKVALAPQANWNKGSRPFQPDPTKQDLAYRAYQTSVRDTIERVGEQAAKVIDPKLMDDFREAKRLFGVAKTADEILARGMDRNNGNNIIGLIELGTGIGAAGIGGEDSSIIGRGVTGLGIAMLTRAARGRAPQVAASLFSKIKPSSVVMKMAGLASVEEAKVAAASRVANAAKRAASGAKKAAAPKPPPKPEAIKKSIEQINKMTPEQHAAKVAEDLEYLGTFAPRIAAAMSVTSTRAMMYLKQVAPKDPIPNRIFHEEYEPPETELYKFGRIQKALEDPASVLDRIAGGDITTEEMQAVRTVYPELYTDMVERVVEEVTKKKGKIPFETKAGLSILLGVAIDPAFEADFIAAMQAQGAPKNVQDASKVAAGEIQAINSSKYLPQSARINQSLGGQ